MILCGVFLIRRWEVFVGRFGEHPLVIRCTFSRVHTSGFPPLQTFLDLLSGWKTFTGIPSLRHFAALKLFRLSQLSNLPLLFRILFVLLSSIRHSLMAPSIRRPQLEFHNSPFGVPVQGQCWSTTGIVAQQIIAWAI